MGIDDLVKEDTKKSFTVDTYNFSTESFGTKSYFGSYACLEQESHVTTKEDTGMGDEARREVQFGNRIARAEDEGGENMKSLTSDEAPYYQEDEECNNLTLHSSDQCVVSEVEIESEGVP